MTKYLKTYLIGFALALTATACRDDVDFASPGSVVGENASVTVPLSLPEMDIKSRSDLADYQINEIQSVWIRTYAATGSGAATSDWKKIDVKASVTPHDPKEVTIATKSGSTYIIAVANVDGAYAVTSDNLTPRPLSGLLEAADTWQQFLDIAVAAPSDYYDINEPPTPLVMSGCFIPYSEDGEVHPDHDNWPTVNFTPYDIKPTGTGIFTLPGRIHLRRIVSQITFNLIPGENISITPSSYRIVNAPDYSWLYERDQSRQANFGDAATSSEDAKNYYATTDIYPSTAFEDGTTKGSYRFSFWQAENKHTAPAECDDYNKRQIKTESDGVTLFTSLTGDSWTPDNMATYVIINCSVDHIDQIKVDDDGNEDKKNGHNVYRSGNATYLIHLGYLDKKPRDFNVCRNTKYTYNIHIDGVDKIRVEAFKQGDCNGVEGLVTDIINPTYYLDCHYHAYNIELTATDLQNFGFITTTYDDGVAHTYQDLDFPDKTRAMTAQEKEYIAWVELRPTTGETVLAEYKPAEGEKADGATFNLLDAARGLTDKQKSEYNWYTVFVNEYTYENPDGNEVGNNWRRYVNQPSRRYYIRVTREISNDGYSLYARSKYAGIQRSIQTYYSNREFPNGGVVGAEHINEVFGLNIGRNYTFPDNVVNGRYNVWLWLNNIEAGTPDLSKEAVKKWDEILRPTERQHIFQVNSQKQNISDHYEPLPSLAYIKDIIIPQNALWAPDGTFIGYVDDDEYINLLPHNKTNKDTDKKYWIEAINACMNRNRDNNGNGQIDPEEVRWYVPTMAKYLRLILGQESLSSKIMDYDIKKDLVPEGSKADIKSCTSSMFFSSDGRAILAFNGMSSSAWPHVDNSDVASTPWDVRCVRNLGTDLRTVNEADKTVPAYIHDEASRTVRMKYYDMESYRRSETFNSNGTGDGQMPVHIISQERYSLTYSTFEYSPGSKSYNKSRYDGSISKDNTESDVENKINNNPCKDLGIGWRIPNVSELAIMRNIGLFDDMHDGGNFVYILSCTKVFYDSQGKGYDILPTSSRAFMGARYDAMLEIPVSWNGKYERDLYYRCVRDVR